MFFRTKTVKDSRLVQLVESFRNAECQPRQRVVASLGDANIPTSEAKSIARTVEDHLRGQGDLLDEKLSTEVAQWVTHILQIIARSKSARPTRTETVDGVLVDHIATENVVQLGPQLVARAAWRALGLDQILRDCGLNTAQSATAQLLVANRLIDWAGRTALPELLGVRITKTTKDRLYHTGDALFAKRKTIESGGSRMPVKSNEPSGDFKKASTCRSLLHPAACIRHVGRTVRHPRRREIRAGRRAVWQLCATHGSGSRRGMHLVAIHDLAAGRRRLCVSQGGAGFASELSSTRSAGRSPCLHLSAGVSSACIDWKSEYPVRKTFVKS